MGKSRKLSRLLVTGLILVLVSGIVTILWTALDWPPPRLILKYGFPPTGGPTGRRKTIEGIEFIELKPGYFLMGEDVWHIEGDLLGRIGAFVGIPMGTQPVLGIQSPAHWVEVSDPFWMSSTEITMDQYRRFDSEFDVDPNGRFDSDFTHAGDHPVSCVDWEEASKFCEWLSKSAGLKCRLPTESEWEFAALAGEPDGLFREWFLENRRWTNPPEGLLERGWFAENSRDRRPQVVGTRRPNPWGFHDLLGSLWEWCLDDYHRNHIGAPRNANEWRIRESAYPRKVKRGGCYLQPADFSGLRVSNPPESPYIGLGIRVVLTGH